MRWTVVLSTGAGLLTFGFALMSVVVGQKTDKDAKPHAAVINGRLTGFDMPDDWPVAERAKKLTYNKPVQPELGGAMGGR